MRIQTKATSGLTLIEVLLVIGCLIILFGMLVPATTPHHVTERIHCVNNLKQIGIACRVWETEYDDQFPTTALTNASGGLLYTNASRMFEYFKVMSNELSNPGLLICRADKTRTAATSFLDFNSNSNTSYFIGLQAGDGYPQMFLSGDRNITNGTALKNGVLELTANHMAGWTEKLHNRNGNVGLADGSVQQLSSAALNQNIMRTGVPTNKLLMPIY